ncbi:LCP family protein [Salininema proteolyticum]|uniref:LCP family protein n=1 Tax=Salininema proteolyticum TaxID=1607685 RepID=A0ABV8U3B5_9ACTN
MGPAPSPDGPTRRGLIGSGIGLVASLVAGGFGLRYWNLADKANDDLNRAFDLDEIPNRPPEGASGAMNILVLGNDSRQDDDSGRSDTAILMHVDAAGKSAYGVSIPRDLWVHIPEDPNAEYSGAEAKFNAAYAWGGANLTVQTLEEYTQVRVDHIVEINFNGLIEVVDAVDGVTIDVEAADAPNYYDETGVTSIHGEHRFFSKGPMEMNGEEALDYVRQRKQWQRGDFARMQHQQQLITGIMNSAVSLGVLSSPARLTEFIESISGAVKVDQGFDVISTGVRLINIRPKDIQFLTSPNLGSGNMNGQSVVISDDDLAPVLYEAVRDDTVGDFLEEYPDVAKN